MNLHQKIVEVRKVAGGFSKDKKSYGYEYVSGNQILSKIKEKMNELNLLLIPSTEAGAWQHHEYTTDKGKDKIDFIVHGKMSYTWVDGDNPVDREVVLWAYYGQQDEISKAYGSALTYSERYFLLKCLGLPADEDDPDAKPESNAKAKQPKQQVNRATVKAKFFLAGGDKATEESFAEWEKSQLDKGVSYNQMDALLTKKLPKGA